MEITNDQLAVTNLLLSLFASFFMVGLLGITYMWEVKKTGPRGLSFPVSSQTNGLGPISNPL